MHSDNSKEFVRCRPTPLFSLELQLRLMFAFALLLAMIRTATALISRSAALRCATLRSRRYLNPSLRTIVILLKLSTFVAFVVLLFSPFWVVVISFCLLLPCYLPALFMHSFQSIYKQLTEA